MDYILLFVSPLGVKEVLMWKNYISTNNRDWEKSFAPVINSEIQQKKELCALNVSEKISNIVLPTVFQLLLGLFVYMTCFKASNIVKPSCKH